jgi:hypothetical protein
MHVANSNSIGAIVRPAVVGLMNQRLDIIKILLSRH